MNPNVIMHKIYVQREVKVWIEDIYHVEDLSEETLEKAINYDLDYDETDTLYDTLVDLGPVKVYDENWNLIKKV
jgi:hypothetical protein